jgi:hypothetical protein
MPTPDTDLRRVLVDEDLDPRLATALQLELAREYRCSSTRSEDLLGVSNGALLDAMGERGFGILVTADRRLPRQQTRRLEESQVGVIVVRAPQTALSRVREIALAVRKLRRGGSIEVDA